MKPKKRGRKSASQVSRIQPKIETEDDDVFEGGGPQLRRRTKLKSMKKEPPSLRTKTTCQITRSRATRASNRKIDNTNKHVDKNCNMSSQNSLETNSETVYSIDSEDDDFELDLTPKRRLRSDSDHEIQIPAKRKKANEFIDISHDENETASTGTSECNEQHHSESSGSQNDDNAPNNTNDEESVASNGANMSEIGDELEIQTEFELEPLMNVLNVPREPVASPDEPEEAQIESTETNKEPDQNADYENESDQGNADDEAILDVNLTEVFDMFEGVGEEEETFSSSASRPKESNNMSIPRWKKQAVSKETPPRKPPIPNLVTKTITQNTNASAKIGQPSAALGRSSAPVPPKEPVQPRKIVPKIPLLPVITKTIVTSAVTPSKSGNAANRDPRMTKSMTKGDAPNNATVTSATITTATAQSSTETSQVAPAVNSTAGQRVSVKDRLGNRYAGKPTGSSFIIPDETSVQAKTGAPGQKNQPNFPSLYTNTFRLMQATQAQQIDKNVQKPHPDLPDFVRQALESKLPTELKIPEFATGIQKYEPLFFRLFERTCRVNMCDECNSNECQFEHKFPDLDIFRKTLDRIGQKRVVEFYDEFICRNQKLFDFYLPEFTEYFGKHSMTAKLKQMVNDCNERKVQFHFIKIVEGFMKGGKPFSKGLKDVVESITNRSIKTSKEVIKLILHARNDSIRPFIDILDSMSKQENFKFSAEWVNRMMFIYSEIQVKGLSEVIWRIINANSSNLQMYDNELVHKFMDDYARGALTG